MESSTEDPTPHYIAPSKFLSLSITRKQAFNDFLERVCQLEDVHQLRFRERIKGVMDAVSPNKHILYSE